MDLHLEERPEGKCRAKFDAEAYVRRHAKIREAELERERAIQSERRRPVDKAVRRAEAKKLELLVNDGVGETRKAE